MSEREWGVRIDALAVERTDNLMSARSLLGASLEKFFLASEENLNQCVEGLFIGAKTELPHKIKKTSRVSEEPIDLD